MGWDWVGLMNSIIKACGSIRPTGQLRLKGPPRDINIVGKGLTERSSEPVAIRVMREKRDTRGLEKQKHRAPLQNKTGEKEWGDVSHDFDPGDITGALYEEAGLQDRLVTSSQRALGRHDAFSAKHTQPP